MMRTMYMGSVMYTMYHVVPYCHHDVAEICHLSLTVSSISLYLAYKLRKKVSEKNRCESQTVWEILFL